MLSTSIVGRDCFFDTPALLDDTPEDTGRLSLHSADRKLLLGFSILFLLDAVLFMVTQEAGFRQVA